MQMTPSRNFRPRAVDAMAKAVASAAIFLKFQKEKVKVVGSTAPSESLRVPAIARHGAVIAKGPEGLSRCGRQTPV
jgi:hypothetical protein